MITLRPLAMAVLLTSPLLAADLTCPSAATLEQLALCVRNQMPRSGSGGFVEPTSSEQSDWRAAVRQMLDGSCTFPLPASLRGSADLRAFVDTENGRTYCVLMEVLDANGDGIVDRGWGTFVTDPKALREIAHQAPHPIADSTTESQAVSVFKGTFSRSYVMAGSHRLADEGSSSCQSEYGPADAAHNVANMLHATTIETVHWYGAKPWTAIQWHGMAADTCPAVEVYLSHGRNVMPLPSDRIVELMNRMRVLYPTWRIAVPGSGACSLNATDNTQGRLLNQVTGDSVCNTPAVSYTGRFIHIEQDPAFRTPADWIAAISEVWPPNAPSKRRRAVKR